MNKIEKISTYLTVIVIILSTIASIGGIFIDNLYQDNDFVNSAWLGNDIITLLLTIPLMIISLSLKIKGSFKANFIWLWNALVYDLQLSFLFVWSCF